MISILHIMQQYKLAKEVLVQLLFPNDLQDSLCSWSINRKCASMYHDNLSITVDNYIPTKLMWIIPIIHWEEISSCT